MNSRRQCIGRNATPSGKTTRCPNRRTVGRFCSTCAQVDPRPLFR